MSDSVMQRDLIVLAADKDIEFAMRGILQREQSLGIRRVEADLFVHPEHDPGCLLKSADFLRPFANSYAFALVMLDLHGSGRESSAREELEDFVEAGLLASGWTRARVCAIVVERELETWVWSDSPQVDQQLNWAGRQPTLRQWLLQSGLLNETETKPSDPKRAFESALRQVRLPRSASLFQRLALAVGLNRCNDPAFIKLRDTLRRWFTT